MLRAFMHERHFSDDDALNALAIQLVVALNASCAPFLTSRGLGPGHDVLERIPIPYVFNAIKVG
jgi:hypothetical protein